MFLDILILAMIREEPRHGYDIKKRVGGVLGLGVTLNNNILYPALRRFEEDGVVKSKLEPQEGSPARRVFRLTPKGREHLQTLLEDFPAERAESDPEFLVRLAFFDLIDRGARLDILKTRRQVLEKELEHLGRMREQLQPGRQRYPAALVEFLIGGIQREVDWIVGLQQQVTREAKP